MKAANKISGYLKILILILIPGVVLFAFLRNPVRLAFVKDYLKNDISRPVSRSVCTAAAKVDFSGREHKYISRTDLREIKKELRPGDIIFRRNEDQLTNFVISGFWTHAGIYIGGKEEINSYFGRLNITGGKKPSDYIEQKYPTVFRKLVFRHNMIIEAVCDGVSLNPIDHFANADYFSAVRPVLDKEELFGVLLTAFENVGKPYDFLFDYQSDDSFFCSELVYKSYLKTGKMPSDSTSMAESEPFITPNDIALHVSDKAGSFSFILFYCADEHSKRASRKNREEFRIYAAY